MERTKCVYKAKRELQACLWVSINFSKSLIKFIPQKMYMLIATYLVGFTVLPSVTAAKTVVKMIEKIQELTPPDFQNTDGEAMKGKANSMTRFIMVKEEHAQICKEQLLILWTDYFKPEHLEMFSDLHDTFWKAAKLCSKNKQEISMEAAQELLKTVEGIADMFQKAEDAKAK